MPHKIPPAVFSIRALLVKLRKDAVGTYAAQSAFFIIISAFPFVMLISALLQFLPFTEAELTNVSLDFFPEAISEFVNVIIKEIYTKATPALISWTAITAVWAASKGVLSLIHGLNAVNDVDESRNYFVLRLYSAVYTVVLVLIIVATLLLMVFGQGIFNWITELVPVLSRAAFLILTFRFIFLLALLTFFFMLLFTALPSRRLNFFQQFPGALFSALGWLVFSLLYRFYIDHIANSSRLYGSLSALVLLMLWIYFCLYILFLGAEFNMFYQYRKRRKEKRNER